MLIVQNALSSGSSHKPCQAPLAKNCASLPLDRGPSHPQQDRDVSRQCFDIVSHTLPNCCAIQVLERVTKHPPRLLDRSCIQVAASQHQCGLCTFKERRQLNR